MGFYPTLKYRVKNDETRKRTAQGILDIKQQLYKEIPTKNSDDHLLLATWNIRDFGKNNKKGFGARSYEDLFYISEIISAFDIVAVQEVNELDLWEEVMSLLGKRNWDYIATDVTEGKSGNSERMTFVYDRRKVSFENIAGEIVLPTSQLISKTNLDVDGDKVVTGKQFARTPFVVSFQAGWLKFNLCTVHIYYGRDSGAKLQQRIAEIEGIAKFFSKRADKELEKRENDKTAFILLGDFNIKHPKHKTMNALVDNGFVIPKKLQKKTNVLKSKYYDQIAFKCDEEIFNYKDDPSRAVGKKTAGVFDIFKSVYKDITAEDPEAWKKYADSMRKCKHGKGKSDEELMKIYKTWRTYHLSDHNPLWVKLPINRSVDYLNRILKDE